MSLSSLALIGFELTSRVTDGPVIGQELFAAPEIAVLRYGVPPYRKP